MSEALPEIEACADCGSLAFCQYELCDCGEMQYVQCLGCQRRAGAYFMPKRAIETWNRSQHLKREHASLKEAWVVVVEELGLTSEFASDADHGKICDSLRELNALAAETLSAREDALRHEGRADYFASLLTSLLATRQVRTVGYEPPDVQQLWRKIEGAVRPITDEKEGTK